MKKIIVSIVLATFIMPMAFASLSGFSITGSADEAAKANKYSLKSLNYYSKKTFSLSSYKNNMQFKAGTMLNINEQSSTSLLQYNNGSSSYAIPFKYTVKVSKFKTPNSNN